MENREFAELFDKLFAKPLLKHGFGFVGRGKSLQCIRGNRQLLILRHGGRLARPGAARSTICFRHTFLRPINSDDPSLTPIQAGDCPRKLTFDDFKDRSKPKPTYRPQNLGRWVIHSLDYGSSDRRNVEIGLGELLETVTERIMPWVDSLTEEGELSQIKRYGEGAWCERRWIDDYEQFLAGQAR